MKYPFFSILNMFDYKIWAAIGIIAIVLVIMNYDLESKPSSTKINLEETCPSNQYLNGYDSNGSVICRYFPISMSNVTGSGISLILFGDKTPDEFRTDSFSYVYTDFPTNPYFTKKYDDTQIWMHLFIDFTNTVDGASDFLSLGVEDMDGNLIAYWNMHDGPAKANNLLAHDLLFPTFIPAGDYKAVLRVAVNSGEGVFLTNVAALQIYEVPITNLPFTKTLDDVKLAANSPKAIGAGWCGDNTLQIEIMEQCDDGNSINYDGCSALCQIEK